MADGAARALRLALVAGAVAGLLFVAFYQAWQRRPSVPHDHDWGDVRGSGVLNAVGWVDDFDGESGRLTYYTGARSGDVGPLTAAPTRAIAAAAHGSVSVRILAFATYEHSQAAEEALALARIVSAATTSVFPAASIPVEIDLYFMPEGARFSLARRIDWREGRPYALAVFARERELVRATPAHELYHVLAARWSLRSTPEAVRRPGAASSYGEAAAELYAACGELMASATLQRPAPSMDRVTLVDPVRGDRVFVGALADDDLVATLDLMRTGADGAGLRGFGPLLAATVFQSVFADAGGITRDSPQGARLLSLCKDSAPNPFAIEGWLAAPRTVTGAVGVRQARSN